VIIRRLGTADAVALAQLRSASIEAEPLAFGASPSDDVHGTVDALRTSLADRDELAVYGAFDEAGSLVGMVGLGRSPQAKRRHKAILWGMYVAPQSRRRGTARKLLEHAISQAAQWPGVRQVSLSVTTAAPGALRLYESAGFRQWGREPRGLQWEGRFEDEAHLVLDLPQEAARQYGADADKTRPG